MATTIRLTDEEAEALRHRAAVENRSMEEIVGQAVREYVERAGHRDLVRVLDEELPQYAESLEWLGR